MVCNLCVSPVEAFGDYYWNYYSEQWKLVKCINCGSIITNPLPNNSVLEKLYEDSFNYDWYKDHIKYKELDAFIRLKQYRRFLGTSVLDYGGGLGYFSEICRKVGIISNCYDPFAGVIDSEIDSIKWDSISLFHVLEHMNSYQKLFYDIDRLLTDDGRIVISVPYSKSIGMKLRGIHWVWFQPPLIHLVQFSVEGLTALLNRNGFKVCKTLFSDRWDANIFTDLLFCDKMSKLEGEWNSLKSIEERKIIADRNGSIRLKYLKYGNLLLPSSFRNSELTIVAKRS